MNGPRLLREWIALEYKPETLKESREKNGGKIILQGVIQRADTKNQNKRIYPSEILKREVENYTKAVRERRAVGELDHPECVQAIGYFILSARGWLPVGEVKDDETVATLDSLGKIVFQPIQRRIFEPYGGKMVHIWNEKGTIEQLVTPNHRVLLWDRAGNPYYEFAGDIHRKNVEGDSRLSHSSMRRAGFWEGNDPNVVVLPGTSIEISAEDWAAFLGIWLAEGYADGTRGRERHGSRVYVCQKDGTERHAMIEALIRRMGIPYEKIFDGRQFAIDLNRDFHRYFFDLGNSHTKRIPAEAKGWSPRLLSVMLEWMLMGDGRNRKGYQKLTDDVQPTVKEYATVSRRLADDVQEVMVKLGYGGTVHTYHPKDRPIEGDRWILAEDSSPIHVVYGHVSRNISMDQRFLKTELVDYEGDVFCVTTSNGNWLARAPTGQVFWTGNSSTVSLSNASHLVTEMWWDGPSVHGKIEVLPTPKGKILETILESGVVVGISSRGVGSTEKDNEGFEVVQPDYQVICFDVVSEPSTPGAFLLPEARGLDVRATFSRADRIFRALNDVLAGGGR